MSKSVNIKYFALLKEHAGVESEVFQTQSKTYDQLYNELKEKYDFPLDSKHVQIAIDDEFSHMNENIADGAKVVFIPPVAGG